MARVKTFSGADDNGAVTDARMRVLIADDDAALRYGLTAQLHKWGYDPVVCEDGNEARAVLRGETPPRLAILDWSMPGSDGIELCREIRSDPSLATIYVVLLTARDRLDAGAHTAADAVAQDYGSGRSGREHQRNRDGEKTPDGEHAR